MQVQRCLLVVADGRRARLFEEPSRGAALAERPGWVEGLAQGRATAKGRPRVFQRFGNGSHVGETDSPQGRSEDRFLKDLAVRIGDLVMRERFDTVALIAPPKALGVLRAALRPAVASRLGPDEAAERCEDRPEDLRAVLRRLREEAQP